MLKWYGKQVFKKVENKVSDSLDKASDIIKKSAKDKVPVDTGNLKSSIDKEKKSKLEYIVGSDEDYALLIEVGTPSSPAQPYLRRSLYDNRNKILKQFRNII